MWVQIVATSLVASGPAWATMAYLSKTLLAQKLAQELERDKDSISRELEAFKLSLNKERHNFSMKCSRLDHQRDTGVMEIHGRICDIEQSLIWQSGSAATARISLTLEARMMDALNIMSGEFAAF